MCFRYSILLLNKQRLLISCTSVNFNFSKGLEDHLGDIDFKIAGTRKGVTACQLDIKPAGIPLDIVCECLEPARKARLLILERMEQEISIPRNKNDNTSPRLG